MQNKFFGSKLNTVLLIVLIILMVIALRWMSQNKAMYQNVSLREQNGEVVPDNLSPEDNAYLESLSRPTPALEEMLGSDGLPLAIKQTGTITKRDDGCFVDGICLVEIDSKYWVVYATGRMVTQPPMGTVEGDLTVGSKVQVYAIRSSSDYQEYKNEYTIVGDSKYYIKAVK